MRVSAVVKNFEIKHCQKLTDISRKIYADDENKFLNIFMKANFPLVEISSNEILKENIPFIFYIFISKNKKIIL
jgi:hypothetical protein